LLSQYNCGPIQFVGTDNALYERHLVFDKAIDPQTSGMGIREIVDQRADASWAHRHVLRLSLSRDPTSKCLTRTGTA
jgi:hypothetical protein